MRKAKNLAVALAIVGTILLCGGRPAQAGDRFNLGRGKHFSEKDHSHLKDLFKKLRHDRDSEVIPAKNGNTGINGSGLPKPTRKNKKSRRSPDVIPAKNGNTGINGSGLPR